MENKLTPAEPTPEPSENVPLLKPKQVRKLSDEQRAIRAESMRQINAKRIEEARAKNALKNPPTAVEPEPVEVAKESLKTKTKKQSNKKKPRIKIITIEDSSDSDTGSDSETDSSDESLPDTKYVFLSKKSKQKQNTVENTKQITKQNPRNPVAVAVPQKPPHKFL